MLTHNQPNASMSKLEPDFAHTDIGVYPSDWNVVELDEICNRITTGKLDANAMKDGGLYRFYTCAKKYYHIDDYAFDTEALLVSGNGANVGYIHYYKGKFNAYQRTYVLSDFTESIKCVKLFLEQNLSERIRVEVNSGNTPYIVRGTLSEMKLALPTSRTEQEALVEALTDADDLIASLESLIVKKRNIKQGVLQDYLTGKRRLKGFSKAWTKRRIGDLLIVKHGKSQRAVEDINGEYPILATGGQIGRANKFLWDKPSVLIGRKGTIDRPQYADTPFWTVDTLFYSHILGENNAKFLYYRFILIDWRTHNEASGVPSLNAKTIENIEIDAPEPDEQIAISNIISDLDSEIEALSIKLHKTNQIKQGMMQELLTGRIRLL